MFCIVLPDFIPIDCSFFHYIYSFIYVIMIDFIDLFYEYIYIYLQICNFICKCEFIKE